MDSASRAKKTGDAKVSIVESVLILAKDIGASDELLQRLLNPKGEGEDKFCNQLTAIAALLVEVTYATGVQDRPVDEPDEGAPANLPPREARREDHEHGFPAQGTPTRKVSKPSRAARKAKRTLR